MRVIAGQLKGRSLKAPRGNRTRPTADRVREAVFSILGSIENLNVLDLYAGTGALGIEALSRGASRAVFVEASALALQCIRANLSDLKLEGQSCVVSKAVERAEREVSKWAPYDLVFCDPPWSKIDDTWRVLSDMNIENLLSPGGRLVLEHPAKAEMRVGNWGDLRVGGVRVWGDSAVTILEKAATDPMPEHPTTDDNLS
jgi:16S rRNA (guanine966-N2)-methyltransferase